VDAQIEKLLAALKARHIKGIFAEDMEEGRLKIKDLIPSGATVGIGDSTAIRQMGLPEVLMERGTKVLDAFGLQEKALSSEDFWEMHARTVRQATVCDVFLTGTNAITRDGKLVNVDAVGNRVAGMFWGHPLSIVVVGKNKIVGDLDEALHRIRNVIAPNHARIRSAELGGGKMKAPCTKTGTCSDCRAIDRICNIFTIIESKPYQTELTVVIVNEDLGLGWDTSWPESRISRIIENYKKSVWVPPGDGS